MSPTLRGPRCRGGPTPSSCGGGPGYCEIPAPNPVTVSAPASVETSVWFSVACNGGTIEVTTTTTGNLPIGTEFDVRFLPTDFFGGVVPLGTVTATGVRSFGNIRPGRRILGLRLPHNCAVVESPNTEAAAAAAIGVGLQVGIRIIPLEAAGAKNMGSALGTRHSALGSRCGGVSRCRGRNR